MVDHVRDDDLVRLLAFDADGGDELRALEAHAESCDACAARLAREARLELGLLDLAEERVRGSGGRSRIVRHVVLGAVAACALAAAIALGLGGERRDRLSPDPSVAMTATAEASSGDLAADGWSVAGSKPERYVRSTETDGARAVRVFQSQGAEPIAGFGTLMQSFSAQKYVGKRVRFSADVRTTDVARWAGLWMRVDAPKKRVVSFDNMQSRPIRGTTAWTRYEVVLDVPEGASVIALGILVEGPGAARLADPRLEIVGADVPVTGGLPSDFHP